MQVTFNPIRFNTSNKNTPSVQKRQNNSINPNTNSMELSNFNTIGQSLVLFRGATNAQTNTSSNAAASNIDLKSKTIEELQDLKKLRQGQRGLIESKKKDAQKKLDAIAAWDYSAEYKKQLDAAESEINSKNLSRFWNPFKCHDIRQNHYNKFVKRNSEIEEYKKKKEQYQDIVSMAPLSDDEAKDFIASIDDMIAQKQQIEDQERRLRGIQGIKDAIEAMNNARGGLNDRIAGYDYEKAEIQRVFIDPLAESQKNPEIQVPSSVLLYGASGTGKTTFLRGIAYQAKQMGYAHVVEMPAVESSEDFKSELKREFGKAKSRYLELGDDDEPKRVRTVLLMNDAEKYFGMSYEQAKKVYGDLIDEADADRLRHINHDTNIIDDFKSILDSCSGIPENKEDKALSNSAVTIFITTNYPHLIDRDLIRKFDAIIPVNPAKNMNLEAVMAHYFRKCSDVITEVKNASQNPQFNSRDLKFLNGYLTKKSIDKLVQMAHDGTLDKLDIDWRNIPYDKIAKDFNPSKAKGAFDNMQLRDLSIAALNDYINEPDKLYSNHYYTRLFNEPRKLDPVRYKHFVDIFNTLAPLNQQEEIEETVIRQREKELLQGLEKAGLLSDKEKKRLEYIRTQELQELNYLEYKETEGTLSEEEKCRLEKMRASMNSESGSDDEDYEDDEY